MLYRITCRDTRLHHELSKPFMDDPWANAWGEPVKHTTESKSNHHDSEADLAAPSWVPGPGIQWSEPSGDQTTLWQPTSSGKEWITSPYESITFGKNSPDILDENPPTEEPEPVETAPVPSPVLTVTNPMLDEVTSNVHTSSPISASPVASEIDNPDAFGTFETGADVDEADVDPWSRPSISRDIDSTENLDTNAWAPSWGAQYSEAADRSVREPGKRVDSVDEWEAAKQQKAKQDQHVVRF